MFGLNNAQLIGRLGADATISHLTNGGRVANVSIATDESYLDKNSGVSTAAGICTGAAAQKCTTGSVVACPHSPWEGPARGATRPPRGWRRPARERGVWAHAGKRGVIRTVAGVVTGSA